MEEKEVKTVKVKLLKAHEHAGISYAEGMEISVLAHDAGWLESLKIIEKVTEDSKTPLAKTTVSKTVEEK